MELNYNLGFEIDGVPIPNPSSHGGTISALDLQAERDATGLLHRDYVATKQPFWLQYNCLPWSAAHNIIRLVADKEEFNVRFRSLKTNSYVTLRAYAGANIEYTVLQAFDGAWPEALVSFKLSIIEF